MPETQPKLRIAQVTPYAIEEERETNRYVLGLSKALQARGHEVVVVGPSHSRKLIKESRARIKQAVKAGGIGRIYVC